MARAKCIWAPMPSRSAPFTNRVTYLEDGDWVVLTRTFGRNLRCRKPPRVAADEFLAGLFHAGRQGQSPPFHGQGNRRAAGSGRPYARRICRFCRARRDACRRSCRSISTRSTASPSPPAARHPMQGLWPNTGSSAIARLPTEVDIASEFRYREAPLPNNGLSIVVSQSGETADTLAALRYCKAQGQHTLAHGQCAGVDHCARMRAGAAHLCRTRDRRGLDQGLHLPACGSCLPRHCWPASCAAPSTRRRSRSSSAR